MDKNLNRFQILSKSKNFQLIHTELEHQCVIYKNNLVNSFTNELKMSAIIKYVNLYYCNGHCIVTTSTNFAQMTGLQYVKNPFDIKYNYFLLLLQIKWKSAIAFRKILGDWISHKVPRFKKKKKMLSKSIKSTWC